MMASIIIIGRITEDGRIEAELPDGWKPSQVEIKIDLEAESVWTDEELDELLKSEPQTGAEIAQAAEIGAWADMGIEDSVAFVEEMRRKRREKNQW
jgi:hypothetical protein